MIGMPRCQSVYLTTKYFGQKKSWNIFISTSAATSRVAPLVKKYAMFVTKIITILTALEIKGLSLYVNILYKSANNQNWMSSFLQKSMLRPSVHEWSNWFSGLANRVDLCISVNQTLKLQSLFGIDTRITCPVWRVACALSEECSRYTRCKFVTSRVSWRRRPKMSVGERVHSINSIPHTAAPSPSDV